MAAGPCLAPGRRARHTEAGGAPQEGPQRGHRAKARGTTAHRVNRMATVKVADTGLPQRVAGLKVAPFTAAKAASSRPCPRPSSTSAPDTAPVASTEEQAYYPTAETIVQAALRTVEGLRVKTSVAA